MDKKLYRALGSLAKAAASRDDENLRELAEQLTANGPNELKTMLSQWLETHGSESASVVPDAGEETMLLDNHDTDLLKGLINR